MDRANIYCYVSVAFLIEADEGETALISTGLSFIFQAQRSQGEKHLWLQHMNMFFITGVDGSISLSIE